MKAVILCEDTLKVWGEKMGASQRRKGHTWEREVARKLRDAMPGCGARRGIQTRHGGGEAADVMLDGPFHIECKAGRKPNIRAALAQAEADCERGMMPVAVIKDDRQRPFVVMTLEDWLDLVAENWQLSRGA